MARARPNPPAVHLITAMVVLLVPVLLVSWWFTRLPAPAATVVDPRPVLQQARAEADYQVAAPVNLPEGWVATRARWTPQGQPGLNEEPALGDTVQLGFLDPAGRYLALDQRDDQPELFVAEVTRDGEGTGTSSVAARTWVRYRSEDGRTRSLVLVEDDHVTIASGDVPFEDLEAFAATLRTS